MKNSLLKIISYLALAGTIIPSLLVFFGDLDNQLNKNIMAVSMFLWFLTAPFWINKKTGEEAVE
jgi:hypothetical protein